MKSLENILPYVAVANDFIISQKPNQLTAFYQAFLSYTDSTERMQSIHDKLMQSICDLPPETTVSIYYIKTFEKENIALKPSGRNIVDYITGTLVNKLTKNPMSQYNCFVTITFPVKRPKKSELELYAKLFAKQNSKRAIGKENTAELYKEAVRKFGLSLKTFEYSLSGRIHRLASDQILQALSLIVNKKYLKKITGLSSIFLSDFLINDNGILSPSKPAYIKYNGNYHAIMSMRNTGRWGRLPDKADASINTIFDHPQLKDIPYIIHHSIKVLERNKGLSYAKLRKAFLTGRGFLAKQFGSFFAKTPEGKTPEELEDLLEQAIDVVEGSYHKFLQQTFQVHLWHNDNDLLDRSLDDFQAVIQEKYRQLRREKINIGAAYFSLFPGNEHINPLNMIMGSFNIADFMPIDLPRNCFTNPTSSNFIHYNNESESLLKLDIFDDRSKNWNALVFGDSGSGKSFFVQSILWQYSVFTPQIAIIDYGGQEAGSYRNFVLNNHGTYLELSDNSKFSVNFFEGPYLVFDEEEQKMKRSSGKLNLLLNSIEKMAGGEENPFTETIMFHLQREISKYYSDHNNNENNDCSIDDFAETHLKDNRVFVDECKRDIYKEIWRFIGDGPYADYMKKTSDITTKDLICFDLEGIKNEKRLKDVIIPALLDLITKNIFGSSDIGRKRLIIMDEAWKDMRGGKMTDFMEDCVRTLRKKNAALFVISQSLLDIMKSPIGEALMTNTSFYYIVGSAHDATALSKIKVDGASGAVNLSDYDINRILNQKGKQDVYLVAPFYCGQLRFYPSLEFIMVSSTNANHKAILIKHRSKVGARFVTPEVIESAKADF